MWGLWGWSSPPQQRSGAPAAPQSLTRVKARGWAQLSHHGALSFVFLFSSTSMNKIRVRELQAPEYCLGNGWQSIFLFTSAGVQTSAQMDLKPNFRHKTLLFSVWEHGHKTPGAFKKGEKQIPEDFIPQTVEILPLQSHESTGELLHPSVKEVYWHWCPSFSSNRHESGRN